MCIYCYFVPHLLHLSLSLSLSLSPKLSNPVHTRPRFWYSDFSHVGNSSVGLKTWSHDGAQTLTKLQLTRDSFTTDEKNKFQEMLRRHDFYRIKLPSNVLNPPDWEYISSLKSKCLLRRDDLEEHFVIHTEGVNILVVNYGAPRVCPYPGQLKLPAKWSFKSHTLLINSKEESKLYIDLDNTLFREIINE